MGKKREDGDYYNCSGCQDLVRYPHKCQGHLYYEDQGVYPEWHIYRAVYNDDSVRFVEASDMKGARFVAERLGNEELCEVSLAWTDEEVRAGKNNVLINTDEGFCVMSFVMFGKTEYHDLYNEASV